MRSLFAKHAMRMVRRLRDFSRERRGNVAMIFALSLIPVMVAGGAGIDLSRALATRYAIQSAVDAAALAVATAPAGTSDAQKQQIAQEYFNANYRMGPSFGTPAAVVVNVTNQQATVSTNVSMPTTLMRVALIDNVPLSTSATVVWGQTKLWVSLVLDTTGSMDDPGGGGPNSKIVALKAATHQLLATLQSASANAGDVKVAIVPFSKNVNVGASNYTQNWIDWTSWDNANGTCTINNKNSRSSCESATTGSCSIPGYNSKNSCESASIGTCSLSGYTTQNSCESAWVNACSNPGQTTKNSCENTRACTKPQYTSRTPCQNNGGVWGYGTWGRIYGVWTASSYGVWTNVNGVWTPANHNTWTGCVADRGDASGPSTPAYDVLNTAPGASAASKFPAEQYNSCPKAIVPLTYDWTALGDRVDELTPAGNTNQTIGLAWGWHALTDGNPLNPGALPSNTTKVIILMSDGMNTQNRWSSSQSSIDARMAAACTNVKNDDVVVYAVFVDTDGLGNSSVLQNCATGGASGGKYYHLTTAGATIAAFQAIATEITNMRVAH